MLEKISMQIRDAIQTLAGPRGLVDSREHQRGERQMNWLGNIKASLMRCSKPTRIFIGRTLMRFSTLLACWAVKIAPEIIGGGNG